jgi:hypothetical protein
MRQQFIAEVADKCLNLRPLEGEIAKVGMAMQEVEAKKLD